MDENDPQVGVPERVQLLADAVGRQPGDASVLGGGVHVVSRVDVVALHVGEKGDPEPSDGNDSGPVGVPNVEGGPAVRDPRRVQGADGIGEPFEAEVEHVVVGEAHDPHTRLEQRLHGLGTGPVPPALLALIVALGRAPIRTGDGTFVVGDHQVRVREQWRQALEGVRVALPVQRLLGISTEQSVADKRDRSGQSILPLDASVSDPRKSARAATGIISWSKWAAPGTVSSVQFNVTPSLAASSLAAA